MQQYSLVFRFVWILVPLCGCQPDVLTSLSTTTEEFTQNAAAAIDVLWVIDDSESMAQEQQGLGESFQAFIDTLVSSNVDYHIGVVSTDPADGGILHTGARGVPFITATTPEAPATFLENVKVGTVGSRSEKGFETAALALGKGLSWKPGDPVTPPNNGFLRDDASLFIIMVSDEDDNSFGPVDYYWRLFDSYKGPGNESRVSVSAICGPVGSPPGCYTAGRGSAEAGYRYLDLASQTGGIFASICDDFNESLAQLSITAAGLKSIFVLNSVPNVSASVTCDNLPPANFCVRVNGTPVPPGDHRSGWTYDANANAIIFGTSSVPPPEAKILIEFLEVR